MKLDHSDRNKGKSLKGEWTQQREKKHNLYYDST